MTKGIQWPRIYIYYQEQTIMADRMTRQQRHLCMSHIRSKDTKPEVAVRKGLFAAGFRYRLNVSALPGTPDIVLKKYNTAIFVNGCFWHGHSGCRHFVMPQTNRQFWQDKIERNIRRDAAVKTRLEALGWKVIVLWECELNTSARRKVTMGRLLASLKDNEAEYCAEQGRRKVLKALRRRENDEKKMRKGALEAEIHNRYDIPRKIVLDSENPALTDLCDF